MGGLGADDAGGILTGAAALLALLSWALAVSLGDIRRRRISNSALLLGVGLALAQGGWRAHQGHAAEVVGDMVVSALAGGICLIPAWRRGMIGGGDVKLGAVAGLLEPRALLPAMIAALLLAVLIGRHRRRLRARESAGESGPDLSRGVPFAPLLLGPLLAVALLQRALG